MPKELLIVYVVCEPNIIFFLVELKDLKNLQFIVIMGARMSICDVFEKSVVEIWVFRDGFHTHLEF